MSIRGWRGLDRGSVDKPLRENPTGPAHNTSGRSRCLVLVGHFTPPVYGMAAAMDALGNLLATLGPLVRLRTVPTRSAGRSIHHFRRVCLVSLAAARLLLLRTKSDAVFLSVDAGNGMAYVVVLTWIARRLGYRVVLQHHSYAYISRRSWLAAALVHVGGSRAYHLYSCQSARDEFRRLYPRAVRTRALSVAYAVDSPPQGRTPRDAFTSRRLRVGHLSNLTLEKGLEEVIRFGRVAIHESQVERVILAGPTTGTAERALIDSVAGERGFEYRGPVTGTRKEDFFRDIDVFLFPTRYRNELSPLVIWEAMLRGVPVIAYKAGCLAQAVLGEGNLVLEPSEDFTACAIRRIEQWSRAPGEFAGASRTVTAAARQERKRAISDALQLGAELFASPRRA
jgi:glycosyltransferase involved in cell wall biosynthesis